MKSYSKDLRRKGKQHSQYSENLDHLSTKEVCRGIAVKRATCSLWKLCWEMRERQVESRSPTYSNGENDFSLLADAEGRLHHGPR